MVSGTAGNVSIANLVDARFFRDAALLTAAVCRDTFRDAKCV